MFTDLFSVNRTTRWGIVGMAQHELSNSADGSSTRDVHSNAYRRVRGEAKMNTALSFLMQK